MHVSLAGCKSYCISAWLPQQHFFPDTGLQVESRDSLLSLSLFPKKGKSAPRLLVNKQPTKSMLTVWEHLFLPGRQLLCLSTGSCTGPLISPLKTKDWTSLWPCGIVHAPLSSLPFPFLLLLLLLSLWSSLFPLAAVERRAVNHSNCHGLWEWDCQEAHVCGRHAKLVLWKESHL